MSLSNTAVPVYDEQWQLIEDFPTYAVSDQGRVINVKRDRLVSEQFNEYTGYAHVSLWGNGRSKTCSIHCLVAAAFLSEPFANAEVNHINGDKLNNTVENLEWMTRGDNHRHAYRTGLRAPVRPNMRPVRCLESGEVFDSIAACARSFGALPSSISNCLAGRRNGWRGLSFEYVDSRLER